MSMRWARDVKAISGFSRASSAIRCCNVDTYTGFWAPDMFPSNGPLKRRPLPSAGSLGRVPPLHRYYEALRTPAVPLAALRCLSLTIARAVFFFFPGMQAAAFDNTIADHL